MKQFPSKQARAAHAAPRHATPRHATLGQPARCCVGDWILKRLEAAAQSQVRTVIWSSMPALPRPAPTRQYAYDLTWRLGDGEKITTHVSGTEKTMRRLPSPLFRRWSRLGDLGDTVTTRLTKRLWKFHSAALLGARRRGKREREGVSRGQ